MQPSGIHPRLSPKDEEVKRKLVKCRPRTYSELIRSDIPEPSGAKPSRPPGPSGVKLSRPSALGPPQSCVMKPSREELQARVEFLAKKKRSAKCKVLVSSEDSHAAKDKVPKLGASSSPSSTQEHGPSGQFGVRGRLQHLAVEVSKMIGLQLRSPSAAVAKSPPRRTAEPPLDIVPISVQSPLSQTTKLPSEASEGEGRKHFGPKRDEDSLLASVELVAGAISSVLRDSDLKRADAIPVEEVLALSLQGATTVSPDAFICSFHRCSKLSVNFISFLQMATYMKSLARRASLVDGSIKALKASKAKVASLASENADLQARVQRLGEDTVKDESDLNHTTTAKARVEDKEKKARGELRVTEDALRVVRDELQVAKDKLHVVRDEPHVKGTTLSRVSQEASGAMSSVERLIDECHGLRGDLQR